METINVKAMIERVDSFWLFKEKKYHRLKVFLKGWLLKFTLELYPEH
jgi:hypothetical protein